MRPKQPAATLKESARQELANYSSGCEAGAIDAFPAQELFQLINEATPVDWQQRWLAAGGKLYDGRMIALKSDPVWARISFFGLPYPPFDEYDVMAVRDVSYTEAVKLGVAPPGVSQKIELRHWSEDSNRFTK